MKEFKKNLDLQLKKHRDEIDLKYETLKIQRQQEREERLRLQRETYQEERLEAEKLQR